MTARGWMVELNNEVAKSPGGGLVATVKSVDSDFAAGLAQFEIPCRIPD